MKLRLNKEKKDAFDLIEGTNNNVFLTGRAGSGKSTLLKVLKEKTKKKMAVLGSTGIAAVNVGGQTVHSFFGFGIDITPEKAKHKFDFRRGNLMRLLERIVIDEMSMSRADLVDCIDAYLRSSRGIDAPFGGVQMILMGDLYQLPPVVTDSDALWFYKMYESPYFFSARAFKEAGVKYVALEKVFRQKEKDLVRILNAIRLGEVNRKDLLVLNSRVCPSSTLQEMDGAVYLTTTNKLADMVNFEQLAKLTGKQFEFSGETTGNFPEGGLPVPRALMLKEGAQIMMTNNDPNGLWVNGDIGRVLSVKDSGGLKEIFVSINGKGEQILYRHRWDIMEFKYSEESKKVESYVRGSYFQYPVKLAWAVTIHKSQGKTFDKVVIDFGKGAFAPGQTYVALSRCTSLEGLTLRRPLEAEDIFVDPKITEFIKKMEDNKI